MAPIPFYGLRALYYSTIASRLASHPAASYRRWNTTVLRTYASSAAPSGYKDTVPSSSKPSSLNGKEQSADQGKKNGRLLWYGAPYVLAKTLESSHLRIAGLKWK